MKTTICSIFFFIIFTTSIYSQDTFSIIAADSSSREVGSAGASCVDLFIAGFVDPSFLGDLLPDTGAINTQATYLPANQVNARTRMRAGDSPLQMISWLTSNDAGSDSTIRQYGIVKFSGNNLAAAGYTGNNCMNYKNHKTGSINGIYYSIQGNILIGPVVIDSMESKFRNSSGDLACRLMAALQGAKIIGADTRCASNNSSSLFAFLKVSQPADNYGSPSFIVTVKTHSWDSIEPIDTLQTLFNIQHNCGLNFISENVTNDAPELFPNPSTGKLILLLNSDTKKVQNTTINIYNIMGEKIYQSTINKNKLEVDLSRKGKGIYFYQIYKGNDILKRGKIILE